MPSAEVQLANALDELNRHWFGMNMTAAILFVRIAQAGRPLTITEASEAAGLPLPSASRNIALLQNRREDKDGPRLDLVEVRPDPSSHRAKLVALTPKGRALYTRITTP